MKDTQVTQEPRPSAVQRFVRGRYRVHVWLNTLTGDPVFGVQRQKNRSWINCAVDGVALLYSSEEKAKQIVRWLNDPEGTEPEWAADAAL